MLNFVHLQFEKNIYIFSFCFHSEQCVVKLCILLNPILGLVFVFEKYKHRDVT